MSAPAAGAARPVPLLDLDTQRRRLEPALAAAIARVFDHGRFIQGPEVRELETRLAHFCGARRAVTTASGAAALQLVLMARGIGPGDAVLCPAFTFCATAEAAALTGATPVFVDVDRDTFNMDAGSLARGAETARRLGLRVRAVVPVDLFGHPADYDALAAVAGEARAFVLADGAQSFGAARRGRRVGTLAPATAVSFYPSKPLGCYGDGGAVITDDDALAETIASLREHGRGAHACDHVRIGLTARLDTLQAAVLLIRLDAFPAEIAARNRIARRYTGALADVVAVPVVSPDVEPVWALYTLRVDGGHRDRVAAALRAEGIDTAIHYPRPLHRQPAYRHFPVADGGAPVAERLADEVLSLPLYPDLSEADQARVIDAVRRAVGRGSRRAPHGP
jgi:dTDP-4-amino-4,6-dideoxygalactose transaminase